MDARSLGELELLQVAKLYALDGNGVVPAPTVIPAQAGIQRRRR